MSSEPKPSLYEKSIAVFLVLVFAGCGWGPYIYKTLDMSYSEKPALFAALAFAVFAMGLVYEAAERLLAKGRGIYAVAVFCSLPATGIIATEPGMLAIAGLMLSIALALWLTSRAYGDDRPYFLGMLGALLLFSGYIFGTFVGTFALLAVIGLATRESQQRVITGSVLFALLVAGMWAHYAVQFGLPTLSMIVAPGGDTIGRAVLPWLPWALWLVPALLIVNESRFLFHWWRWIGGFLLLILIAAAITHNGMETVAAAAAPLLALLAADVLYESFSARLSDRSTGFLSLPLLILSVCLLLLSFLSSLKLSFVPIVGLFPTAAALVLAAGIVWTVLNGLIRWSFPFLFGAGLLFGRVFDTRDPILSESPSAAQAVSLPTYLSLLAATVLLFLLLQWTVGRRFQRVTERDREFRFGGSNFQILSQITSSENIVPAEVRRDAGTSYSFVIFGDVTGAESPFSTRRGGYFVFRSFAQLLNQLPPLFAISLGDLASQATGTAYSKLHRLLSQVNVPLMVTPGNHDLFSRDEYNAAHFHELFGHDNAAFQIGPVQYILLNNAWGSIDPVQFVWLEEVLQVKSAPFTFIFCHKPPFELREHEFYAMEERPHAERLHELFRTYHVTAVVSGHIHALLSKARDGVTYIVSGGGGSKLVEAEAQHHYLHVTVNESEITLKALPISQTSAAAETTPLLELHFKASA